LRYEIVAVADITESVKKVLLKMVLIRIYHIKYNYII